MTIYQKDPIGISLGVRNIYELVPDFDLLEGQKELEIYTNGSGELNSFFGKTHTEETKELYSKQRKGEGNGMHGRSIVTEKKLRWYNNGTKSIYVTEGTQPYGFVCGRIGLKRKPHTEEHKRKISRSLMGNPAPNRKTVISPEGLVFESIKTAAIHCNLTTSQFKYRMVYKGDWVIR